MEKYKNQKEVIDLMKEGWVLEEKRNYKGKIVSYWMHKKGYDELSVRKTTRDCLYKKGLIDSNDCLVIKT